MRAEEPLGCEANYTEEIRQRFRPASRIQLHDVTLRDGEGTPGVAFDIGDKVAVARALDGAGVHRIEAGELGAGDLPAITAVARSGLRATVMAWSSTRREDLEQGVSSGVAGLVVGIPVGQPALRYAGVSEAQVLSESIDAINFVKERGLQVVYFPYDTTRARLDFLRSLLSTIAQEAKPDSVAIVDTRGVAVPEAIRLLVTEARELTKLPIEVHCHNDFGLAVANSLAGVAAGAEVVHTSVAGLGERCGNTPLEAFAMALALLYRADAGIRLTKLYDLARLVASHSRLPIAHNQPVTGKFAFVRVTGGGVDSLRQDPTTIFPYPPELAGRTWEVWLGKVSSAASVAFKLEQLGLAVADADLDEVVALVRQKAVREKRCVTDQELAEMVRHVISTDA